MIGVRLTLGYRREKNKLVEEPAIENRIDKNHMRGVSIDKERLSVAATEARTCAYGELSVDYLSHRANLHHRILRLVDRVLLEEA